MRSCKNEKRGGNWKDFKEADERIGQAGNIGDNKKFNVEQMCDKVERERIFRHLQRGQEKRKLRTMARLDWKIK